jgi:hypothetical protein
MLRFGFEPTIPVFERTKTVHALDRAATVKLSFWSGIFAFPYAGWAEMTVVSNSSIGDGSRVMGHSVGGYGRIVVL